jgi:hypothetical protein
MKNGEQPASSIRMGIQSFVTMGGNGEEECCLVIPRKINLV